MIIIKITNNTPDNLRVRLINFVRKHGGGHITLRTIRWLKNTTFSSLKYDNGDLIYVYMNNNKIYGVIAVSHYGLKYSIVVVHSEMRKKGIATNLINEALNNLDRLYFRVANDNIPSLRMCFSISMRAFTLTKGPTGKPTLVLGAGNYDSEEWKKYSSGN